MREGTGIVIKNEEKCFMTGKYQAMTLLIASPIEGNLKPKSEM